MQQKIVSLQQQDGRETGNAESHLKVFAECTVPTCSRTRAAVSEPWRGPSATGASRGASSGSTHPQSCWPRSGIGKSFKVTSNSWEYTGDGHALALRASSTLINMEFVQFHPTGMVWPPSVKGILVTESVRGDGGVLQNSEGKRFMFDYVPDVFGGSTPRPRRRATAGTHGPGQQQASAGAPAP